MSIFSNFGRTLLLFSVMFLLLLSVGFLQSWDVALVVLHLCLISSLMSLGVNIQWGYGGLFNVGIVGFVAIGGVSAVLVSHPPVVEAWSLIGLDFIFGILIICVLFFLIYLFYSYGRGISIVRYGYVRYFLIFLLLLLIYVVYDFMLSSTLSSIESLNPALAGFLGGLGLPIMLSWLFGGVFAGFVAYFIGRLSLGLRSDYLAIATLGISEIIVSILKNEEWLSRGVKNVTGLSRPVWYEVDLRSEIWFIDLSNYVGIDLVDLSSLWVKLSYVLLFMLVLFVVLYLSEVSLRSPWGRMMRSIRDNEVSAESLGKDVRFRHLQLFVLGSFVVGVSGAMLVTLDGQFTPSSYHPLRFTFLVWVMVIVGGSGNNFGSVLGGFLVWYFWVLSEPIGFFVIDELTSFMSYDSVYRLHFLSNAGQLRLLFMGLLLLLILRFAPFGLLSERR